jgi:hypothetical protein
MGPCKSPEKIFSGFGPGFFWCKMLAHFSPASTFFNAWKLRLEGGGGKFERERLREDSGTEG